MEAHWKSNNSANHSLEISPTVDAVFEYWYQYYSKQGERLYHYGFPLFLFTGLLGNVLCVILILRGTFHHMPCGVLFLLLSFSDLSVNVLGIVHWLPEATMGYVISSHDAVCKVTQYFGKLFEQTSSWMIVAITVERVIVVTMPHWKRFISSKRQAMVLSGIIVAILGSINVYQPMIVGIVEDGQCFFIEKFNDQFIGVAFALTDLLIYSFLPSIILIICNVTLVVNVGKNQMFTAVGYGSEAPKHNTGKFIVMVITLNVVFVVLTLPHSCFIISDFVPPDVLYMPTTRELWFYIVALLLTLNHSINFFLYFFTNIKFRRDFWKLFGVFKSAASSQIDGCESRVDLTTVV